MAITPARLEQLHRWKARLTMPQKSLARKPYPVSHAATIVTEHVVYRRGRPVNRHDNFGTFFAPNLEIVAKDADLGVLQFRIFLLNLGYDFSEKIQQITWDMLNFF